MQFPTPTSSTALPLGLDGFETLTQGLDHAARGETGFNYYSVRHQLVASLSYAELRDRALAAARRLLRLGLRRGARVALIAETSPDFHTLFFGCQYAGLVPVPLPLPVNLGGREAYVRQLRRMIGAAGAAAAFAPAELVEMLQEAAEPLSVAFLGAPDALSAQPEGGDPRPLDKHEPCYIQYSSGSTSAPKGVVVTQRAATANAHGIIRHGLQVRPGDRCVSWLPLYHDMGLVGFCIAPMLSQLSVDYLATLDFARRPLLWLQLMAANGGTISFSPSFGYDLCARRAASGAAPAFDLSAWRVAGIGGDMVRPDVLARFAETFAPNGFRRTAFVPSYGLAESTLAVSFAPLDRGFEADTVDREALASRGEAVPVGADASPERARAFVLCGRPLPDHELSIRDTQGRPLPERRVGRVLIRGPSVMSGYFEDPEATAAALSPDGWLDTGDLGYLVGGALVITGRSKDLIIHNGRNIWPQDIEWAVERLPGLRQGDAAAFAVTGADGGEAVVAVVQCRLSDPGARERLRHQIAATVRSTAGIDCEVVLVPPHSLPLTSSGKLSRAATRANYLSGRYAAPPHAPAAKLAAEG